MSNEPPKTAGAHRESAAQKSGIPDAAVDADADADAPIGYADDADATDFAEHPDVEQPVAPPFGAGAHAAQVTESAPDGLEPVDASEPVTRVEPVTLVEPEQFSRAEYAGTPEERVSEPVREPVEVPPAMASESEPVAVTPSLAAADASAYPSEEPSVQTVYIHAPVAPKRRGNRAVGSLIALASVVVFAAIYAGIALVVMPLFTPKGATGFEFLAFVRLPVFYVPILVFLVAFVLLVLIVNRANWWAYVLGSFIVALLVYFVSIGILLLSNGVIAMTPNEALQAFAFTAFSPLIIATIVAREVPIWFGAAIAARGRRQKQRNAEEKAAFDAELASSRTDFTRNAVDYGTN